MPLLIAKLNALVGGKETLICETLYKSYGKDVVAVN